MTAHFGASLFKLGLFVLVLLLGTLNTSVALAPADREPSSGEHALTHKDSNAIRIPREASPDAQRPRSSRSKRIPMEPSARAMLARVASAEFSRHRLRKTTT